MTIIITVRERMMEEDGGDNHKEDQGKGVGMGGSLESPCQFLECHLALLACDDLLG